MIEYRLFLEDQIGIQREAIARWRRWFVTLLVGGLAIFILGQLVATIGVAGTEIVRLAGVFVGAISVFPYREVTPREERIATYSVLLRAVDAYKAMPPDEQQRLLALIGDAMKETFKR